MRKRRRTDHLPAPEQLPSAALDRAHEACDALMRCGLESAIAFRVEDSGRQRTLPLTGGGRIDVVTAAAEALAEESAGSGRALVMREADDPRTRRRWRLAAISCGTIGQGELVVVAADPRLTRREAQTIAMWAAPAGEQVVIPDGAGCADIAHSLAVEHGADVAVIALFAQAGMLLNMHVRSGALLRTWRAPVDTVWGEAARHAAAFVLGDLHLHPGAETLSSLGLRSAAVVGIENGSGVAAGAIGVATRGDLEIDIAHSLLARAPAIGPLVMDARGRTRVPQPDDGGAVELREFAARIGCRRFALYSKTGNVVTLVGAYAQDGSILVSPPDQYEEQLVCWAAEKGIAVASDDAAAVMVGEDTVLYAADPEKRPMECLRLALQDLRNDPYGRRAA